MNVSHIRAVFQFGWKYLRRYWARLAAGVLLGLLFGLSNASFVWASKTLIERFEPPQELKEIPLSKRPGLVSSPSAKLFKTLGAKARRIQNAARHFVDPWLPRAGTPLNWQQTLGLVLLLPLLVLFRSATDYGSNYCMGWVSERVINDMRLDVMEKLSTLSLDFFNRSTTGDLLTRINGDTGRLLRCLKQGSADLIKEPISLASVLLYLLLFINWKLTLFALILLPLCLLPLLILGKKARRASRAALSAEISQSSHLVELLASIRIVKAYNLESEQIRRFRDRSRQLVHHGMKGVQAKELTNPIIEVISMLGLGALLVYTFKTQTSVGDFVGFLSGLMFLFLPIKKLAGVHILFEQASIGVIRLREILNEQPSVKEPTQPKTLIQFRSGIRFENVSFAYADQPVLQDVNLAIPRGIKLGVAGTSGSGKSTLVNLLFRFYDSTAGSIKIDGIDLRELAVAELRQLMALVSQEVVIFDQTVAENIACGKPGASRAEVEAAARDAYAHEFIQQLPQGYDTRVGERGVTLSGGQRQRITIARAFVRNAPILVLDEATGSLDSEAEAEVQRAIDHLSENRTVISVAHRLSTLATTERIIVLSEGRIIEHGSFNQLLDRGGAFAAMAKRQGIFAGALRPV